MARTPVPVRQITRQGLDSVFIQVAADINGQFVQNDGNVFLIFFKGPGADATITISLPRNVGGQDVVDVVMQVTNGDTPFVGPFPPRTYNQRGADGDVIHIDYDSVILLSVAALRID